MIVNQRTTAQSLPGGTANSDSAKADLDYDSFLKLLVATMQNQDPTQPNDPAQTLSQLASFSNVEQSIKLNEKLESLLSTSGAAQASALIGRTVSNLNGTVSGQVVSVEVVGMEVFAVLRDGSRLDTSTGYKVS
ncbi:flagellar hook assembly protein FlgD [Aestuariivirga sp.]|uniref:flagellar hook assembly protein FlgD n=1 Tax=Aestuariivirga sp. TaxID=2650926 RepID=UPI00359492FD